METQLKIPNWLKSELFVKILKENITDFENITNFKISRAEINAENSITTHLNIKILIKLRAERTRILHFILKIPESADYHVLFLYETDMYRYILPQLEEICSIFDTKIKFAPQCYFFSETIESDYILMENLQKQGFRSPHCSTGLNEIETKFVLKKLAQWHAATVKRIELFGQYNENYKNSFFVEAECELIENMNKAFENPFLESLRIYNLEHEEITKVETFVKNLFPLFMKFGEVHAEKFNVLNHGDFWLSNLLIHYNGQGESRTISEVMFIDFQLPKYGNPAQDLFSFLMTSPAWEIRLEKFDEFIDYYYNMLITQLQALSYLNLMPSFEDLKKRLMEGGLWAFIAVQRILPLALFNSNENSNLEPFLGNTSKSIFFRKCLFLNPVYIKQMEKIIPWLIRNDYLK